jgi:hypothetical protein
LAWAETLGNVNEETNGIEFFIRLKQTLQSISVPDIIPPPTAIYEMVAAFPPQIAIFNRGRFLVILDKKITSNGKNGTLFVEGMRSFTMQDFDVY